MSTLSPLQRAPKSAARVALHDAGPEVTAAIRSLLTQPGIELVVLPAGTDPGAKKFEGFVVDLRREDAAAMLTAIRGSGRNRRAVIFGIYADETDTRPFSKFGINGLLHWPVRRADAVKALRATSTLLTHELRRYARIPLATDVEVTIDQRAYSGISRDLSGGGMSILFQNLPKTAPTEPAECEFLVPPGKKVGLHGFICWIHEPERLIGVQFQSEPEALKPVKAWVDDYLGIG